MQLSNVAPVKAATDTFKPMLPDAAKGDLRIAQVNAWNLFDTVDDPKVNDDDSTLTQEQYQAKLNKVTTAIAAMGLPDVVSLNEVENDRVMRDLLGHANLKKAGYEYVLAPTNDRRGISVAMLYKPERLEKVAVDVPNETFSGPDTGRGQVDSSLLYARAPLVVDFKLRGAAQATEGSQLLTIAVNHFKSKLGGDAPEQRRVRQGEFLGEYLDDKAKQQPGGTTIVVGDLNAVYGDGAYEKLANRPDGSKRYFDAPLLLPEDKQYTYIYRGQKNMLDHLMIDDARKDAITGAHILHVNSGGKAYKEKFNDKVLPGFSDHDPIVVDFDAKKLFG